MIMSPTEIVNAQWPGGERPSLTVADPTLPRMGDRLVVDGRQRTIEAVNPMTVNGELVRIELRISFGATQTVLRQRPAGRTR